MVNNGGDDADALDVFQESVVILYLNCQQKKYEPRTDSRMGTYLYGIGRNVWRARLRKDSKLDTVPLNAAGPEPPGDAPDEAQLERIERLHIAFANLGANCRRLLRLFYYEKIPLRQIAELMTFTEKTAKNNKYRCMQQLRKSMNAGRSADHNIDHNSAHV